MVLLNKNDEIRGMRGLEMNECKGIIIVIDDGILEGKEGR